MDKLQVNNPRMYRVIKIIIHGPGFQPPQYKNKGFTLKWNNEYSYVVFCPELSFKRYVYSDGYIYERIMVKRCARTFEDAEEFAAIHNNEKNSYCIIEHKVGSRWVEVVSC